MTTKPRRFTATLGFWSFVGLGLGFVLGIYGFQTGSEWVGAVARGGEGSSMAGIGRRTLAFVLGSWGILVTASFLISRPLVGLYEIAPETV